MSIREKIASMICEDCGQEYRLRKADAILAEVERMLEDEKWGYLHGIVNCKCESCEKVNNRNKIIDDMKAKLHIEGL